MSPGASFALHAMCGNNLQRAPILGQGTMSVWARDRFPLRCPGENTRIYFFDFDSVILISENERDGF